MDLVQQKSNPDEWTWAVVDRTNGQPRALIKTESLEDAKKEAARTLFNWEDAECDVSYILSLYNIDIRPFDAVLQQLWEHAWQDQSSE